jgi:predicted nucleic acid-binding protein
VPVVDARVVVDWVAPGVPASAPALRVARRIADAGDVVLAPRLLLEEVTNALLTGVRRRRWTGNQADSAFALLRELPVQLVDEPADLDRAYELSRRYDEHPIYDMVYVAVAERLGQPLITADAALRSKLVLLPFLQPAE